MDSQSAIFALIGIVAGTILGFLLNELAVYFRARREAKARLRVALYNLLEVHFYFVRTDPSPILDLFMEWLKSKGMETTQSTDDNLFS